MNREKSSLKAKKLSSANRLKYLISQENSIVFYNQMETSPSIEELRSLQNLKILFSVKKRWLNFLFLIVEGEKFIF
jgi:hypothetical protein